MGSPSDHASTDLVAPVGWVCTRNDETDVAFEPDDWSGEVRATYHDGGFWQVQCVERVGEAESVRPMGYSSTRDGAIRALFECMSAMNRVRDRTGVVRSMLTSALAVRSTSVDVRAATPDWQTEEVPFEAQVTSDVTRDPWFPD